MVDMRPTGVLVSRVKTRQTVSAVEVLALPRTSHQRYPYQCWRMS